MDNKVRHYLNVFNSEVGTGFINFSEKTSMEIAKALESDPYILMIKQAEKAETREYLEGFHLTINGYKNKLFKDQIIDESQEGGSILTGEYSTSLYELISRLNMYNLRFNYDSTDINDIYENSTGDVLFPTLDLYVNLPYPICIDHMTDEKLQVMITNVKTNIEQGVEAMISGIIMMTHNRRYSDLNPLKKQDNLLSLLGIKTIFIED